MMEDHGKLKPMLIESGNGWVPNLRINDWHDSGRLSNYIKLIISPTLPHPLQILVSKYKKD